MVAETKGIFTEGRDLSLGKGYSAKQSVSEWKPNNSEVIFDGTSKEGRDIWMNVCLCEYRNGS